MKISNDVKSGVLVFVSIAFFIGVLYKAGAFNFSKRGYEIKAKFSFASGIEKNAPVRLSGVEIGRVVKIELKEGNGTEALLTMLVSDKAVIPSDSKVLINILGLMGEKYVEIISAGTTGEPLKPGDTIIGEAPFQMEQLFKKGEEIADNLDQVLTGVHELTGKLNAIVDENRDSINHIFQSVERTTANLDGLVETHKDGFGRIIQNADSLTGNLNELVKENKKSFGRIIENTESATKSLDEILTGNKDELERIMTNAEEVSSNFVDFSEDIKRHPWKLLVKGKEQDK